MALGSTMAPSPEGRGGQCPVQTVRRCMSKILAAHRPKTAGLSTVGELRPRWAQPSLFPSFAPAALGAQARTNCEWVLHPPPCLTLCLPPSSCRDLRSPLPPASPYLPLTIQLRCRSQGSMPGASPPCATASGAVIGLYRNFLVTRSVVIPSQ